MRTNSTTPIAVGSLIALAALIGGLWWRERPVPNAPTQPLIVYAAPTSRLPLEVIAADYGRETGRQVELRIGPSEDILTKVRLPAPGEPADLFIPADDSYIRQARELGLVTESARIAHMRAVVLLTKDNPKNLAEWADLLRDGVKVAVPNPGAAVGKLTREHLAETGRWAALAPRAVDTGSVTEAANAARLGSADAAVVWDAVAAAPAYRGQRVLALPELAPVTGRVEVALLSQSRDPEAARALMSHITDPNRGLVRFREFGFQVEEQAGGISSRLRRPHP
ncbi:molybdate ABC transporter substrate-binding protein [Gemmata sp. JC673]|uniref:Molybdate ABC transporter substrate-binding protein n=1 Tax=Gemmata algarum TaxID=2975278 RepID=A0ABU5F7X1_9BACT|nr:molybdate ABC transporter substrate-binding protein [Gemmata algarum]MDY3563431.1 molybdate ABC transporter substrate-binding protein [Gemmata algarum]